MTVYVVTSGEYSDYGVCEVFLNRDKAELYCAAHNQGKRWDDYIIEEYESHDDSIEGDHDDVVCLYKEYLNKSVKDGKWIYTLPKNAFDDDPLWVMDTEETEVRFPRQGAYVQVVLDRPNKDKALKIAQDMVAKVNAERIGI